MKRLIRNKIHLAEVLKKIVYIEFCKDVTKVPMGIAATSDIDSYDDKLLLKLSDDKLTEISDTRMELIQDGEVLDRLYQLCPERFSEELLKRLQQYYSDTTFEIDTEDIKVLLEYIKECNQVVYHSNPHKRTSTDDFILDSGDHVRQEDCLKVLKSLTVDDYRENKIGADPRYFGDDLIVFRTYQPWTTLSGTVLTDICIYIKLDLNMSNGNCVAIVSFHDAKYQD